jgi:hypothetical protein
VQVIEEFGRFGRINAPMGQRQEDLLVRTLIADQPGG